MGQPLTLDLPDTLLALLGPTERAAARTKEALVLQLLREAEISQGQAAEFLGITRWDLLDLMARHDIPSGPETAADLDREVQVLQDYLRRSASDDGS